MEFGEELRTFRVEIDVGQEIEHTLGWIWVLHKSGPVVPRVSHRATSVQRLSHVYLGDTEIKEGLRSEKSQT